jgi:hypothetical protein
MGTSRTLATLTGGATAAEYRDALNSLGQHGLLDRSQAAALSDLSGVETGALEDLRASLVATARTVDPATASDADIDRLSSLVIVASAAAKEVCSRGTAADRRRQTIERLVGAITADATPSTPPAASPRTRLPSMARLAQVAPRKTRPLGRPAVTLSIGGREVALHEFESNMAATVAQNWGGSR